MTLVQALPNGLNEQYQENFLKIYLSKLDKNLWFLVSNSGYFAEDPTLNIFIKF